MTRDAAAAVGLGHIVIALVAFTLGVVVGRAGTTTAPADAASSAVDPPRRGSSPDARTPMSTPRTQPPTPQAPAPLPSLAPAPPPSAAARPTTERAWDEVPSALPEATFQPLVAAALEACAPAATLAAVDCAEPPCLGAVRGPAPPQDGAFQACVARALDGRVAEDDVLYWEVPIAVRCGDTVEDFWLVGLEMTTLATPRARATLRDAGDTIVGAAMQIGRSAERIAAGWPCP